MVCIKTPIICTAIFNRISSSQKHNKKTRTPTSSSSPMYPANFLHSTPNSSPVIPTARNLEWCYYN